VCVWVCLLSLGQCVWVSVVPGTVCVGVSVALGQCMCKDNTELIDFHNTSH
jgi:hypothetical protein